jgi:hypothetical protein
MLFGGGFYLRFFTIDHRWNNYNTRKKYSRAMPTHLLFDFVPFL